MTAPIDNIKDDHSRTIIHIDMDCFYAQVEMNRNESLRNIPMGIQQKNYVITSNYIAREYGIKKCMLISDAKRLCPELVLVNGEDLQLYKQISQKVTALLQTFSPIVERLGLDENFIDVSKLVAIKFGKNLQKPEGNIFGSTNSERCQCGCEERLNIGSILASEIREKIYKELNLTSCSGVAHNKLLAKLVCSTHKPNQQTLIYPYDAVELMLSLGSVRKIPGIGLATAYALENISIRKIEDLQNADWKDAPGVKLNVLRDLSYGIDASPVKPSGKPLTIGLEDSCKTLTVESEIRARLCQLLSRLLILIKEDGRIPKTLKLTVRKFDKTKKVSNRETRQCNINPNIFMTKRTQVLPMEFQDSLMSTLMYLFKKIVDIEKPYHVTLLGLSCTKFQEPVRNNFLTNFLRKNLEVQSITSIESKEHFLSMPLNIESSHSATDTSDIEADIEPSPKKLKLSLGSRKSHLGCGDCSSPSKLNVADLRLSCEKENVLCPPNANKEVFEELPRYMQKELWEEYKREREKTEVLSTGLKKKIKVNTLLNYFVKD